MRSTTKKGEMLTVEQGIIMGGEGSEILWLTSRTLDDALWLGEDRASRAECFDIFPGLVARLVRVDTRHAA